MATAVESQDTADITTCPICLEKYDIPKYLPCLHTFCENCIETYISNSFERENKKDIQCPVCRSEVTKPKADCGAAEWAKTLPLNFLIVELLEKQKVFRVDKQCMICERMGMKNEAKFMCSDCADLLCENCKRTHGAIKTSREHEVRAIDEGNELSSCKFFKNKCLLHKNEDIKLFCMDHEEPCCTICVSINHRKCEKVVTIEDAAADYENSKEVEELTGTLEKIEGDVLSVVEERKKCKELIEKQYKECEQDNDKIFSYLELQIKSLRNQRKAELAKKYTEAIGSVETTIMQFLNQQKIIKNERYVLNACVDKASPPQIMIEVQQLKRRLDGHIKLLKNHFAGVVEFNIILQKTDIELLVKELESVACANVRQIKRTGRLALFSPEIHAVHRLSSNCDCNWIISGLKHDAINFQTSEVIQLRGVMIYMCKDESSFQVSASVCEGTSELGKTCTVVDSSKGENKICNLMLARPILINANTKYRIDVLLKGSRSYSGSDGTPIVDCNDVTFYFEKSDASSNGTTVTSGQIPGLLFSKLY